MARLARARRLRRAGLHAAAGDVPVVAEAPVAECDARAPGRRREVVRLHLPRITPMTSAPLASSADAQYRRERVIRLHVHILSSQPYQIYVLI